MSIVSDILSDFLSFVRGIFGIAREIEEHLPVNADFIKKEFSTIDLSHPHRLRTKIILIKLETRRSKDSKWTKVHELSKNILHILSNNKQSKQLEAQIILELTKIKKLLS